MKVYVDENREVYTEETINDKIRETLESFDYEGVVDYLLSKYTEGDILNMLISSVQEEVFDYLKADILQANYYEQEINAYLSPYDCYCSN